MYVHTLVRVPMLTIIDKNSGTKTYFIHPSHIPHPNFRFDLLYFMKVLFSWADFNFLLELSSDIKDESIYSPACHDKLILVF